MGGTIAVTSRVGIGSTFSVSIPFACADHAEAEPTDDRTPTIAPTVAPAGGCLLVVEDNAVNQLVMKAMVRNLGYSCDVAGDGLEALAALDSRRYSAVIMDCYMPEMDGFVATKELRRREGNMRHTPVIALTAGATSEDNDRCIAAGMDDYLSKPVSEAQFAQTLNRWVYSD